VNEVRCKKTYQNLSTFNCIKQGKVVPLVSLAKIMLKGGGITSTKTQSKEVTQWPIFAKQFAQ
jgi:hypothetical protein